MDDMTDNLVDNLLICPLCCGPAVPLGRLGDNHWFRCRCCGMEFPLLRRGPKTLPINQRKGELNVNMYELQEVIARYCPEQLPLLTDFWGRWPVGEVATSMIAALQKSADWWRVHGYIEQAESLEAASAAIKREMTY
ncbi:MAG: hypothetical protein ACYC3G_00660 [Minisyncoccota bacterium]